MSKSSDADWGDSLKRTYFVRTLSYREFLSTFALSLLMMAIASVLNYLSDNEVDQGVLSLIYIGVFSITNHAWYKIEHRRSNNFAGRILHDYIFVLSLLIVIRVISIIRDGRFPVEGPDGGQVISYVIEIVLFIAILEAVIGLLKRLLKRTKWQIL